MRGVLFRAREACRPSRLSAHLPHKSSAGLGSSLRPYTSNPFRHTFPRQNADHGPPIAVRRKRARIFRQCNSRPQNWSVHPLASGAAEETRGFHAIKAQKSWKNRGATYGRGQLRLTSRSRPAAPVSCPPIGIKYFNAILLDIRNADDSMGDMQFESLKVFCDVIRNQSFSQAAEENHVTQSAVSQIVSQLEKRLGVVLINRPGRPLTPTREGQVYYEGCKKLVEQYMELEASIRHVPPELPVTVRVAAIYSVGLGDMGQYVERFESQHLDARIQIEYLHPDRVMEKVLDGSADLGLVSFPPRSRDLRTLRWREEEMLLTCSPQHPLAAYSAIQPKQLAGEKYVGFSKELTIRRKVDQFLRAQDHRRRGAGAGQHRDHQKGD